MRLLAERIYEQQSDDLHEECMRKHPSMSSLYEPRATHAERLEDLLIRLQRRVEDLRRQTERERMRGEQSK
jgi:hypothetical protein